MLIESNINDAISHSYWTSQDITKVKVSILACNNTSESENGNSIRMNKPYTQFLLFYLGYCHYTLRDKTKLHAAVPSILYATLRCIIDTFIFKRLPSSAQVFRNNHNTQIYLRGLDGKTFAVNVKLGNDVKELRAMIREEKGIRVKEQRLTFGGKQLIDGKKLFEYNIQKESTLDLSLRLCGGMLCDKV